MKHILKASPGVKLYELGPQRQLKVLSPSMHSCVRDSCDHQSLMPHARSHSTTIVRRRAPIASWVSEHAS